MACTYQVPGQNKPIEGQAAFKAWLVNGGLDVLYPDGSNPLGVKTIGQIKNSISPSDLVILQELAKHDEVFRHPVSDKKTLKGIMAEVMPSAEFIHDNFQAGTKVEAYQTEKGNLFWIYEKGNQVWIDVSNLKTGEFGNSIYAAVGNYAYNTGKVFIGDPNGLSEAAVIRRTNAMLSLALKFGSTEFLGSSPEQAKGNPSKGIKPLKWGDDYTENVTNLIDSLTGSLYDKVPILKGYRYDFERQQYEDRLGRPLAPNWASRLAQSDSGRMGRAGEATLRRAVILQSIASSSGREKSQLLERIKSGWLDYSWYGLGGIFSKTNQGATGSTVEQIKSWLPANVMPMLASGKLRIDKSHGNSQVEAYYDGANDVVVLVADKISKDSLSKIISHELLHRAESKDPQVKAAFERFEQQFKRSFEFARGGKGSDIEKTAYQRVIAAGTPANDQLEEFRAYIVSEYQRDPDSVTGHIKKAIQDLIAAIRAFLVRAGLDGGFIKLLTPADLAAMSRYGAKVASNNVVSGNLQHVKASAKAQRFYSALKRAFVAAPERVFGKPEQIKLWINGNASKYDVKKDEIYWSGLTDWLDMQTGKVSRDDVINYLEQNGVQVEDVVLGETAEDMYKKLSNEELADRYLDNFGESVEEEYGPDWADSRDDVIAYLMESEEGAGILPGVKHNNSNLTLPGGVDYRELVVTIPTTGKFNEQDSTHFGDVGGGKQIAWIRHNTRTDADGNTGLFLEEVQSQRSQKGREKGFRKTNLKELPEEYSLVSSPNGNWGVFDSAGKRVIVANNKEDAIKKALKIINASNSLQGIPPAPFVTDSNNKATNAYISLLLKKAVSQAIDDGKNFVAWTTGDQQADRYDLSKQVDSIEAGKNPDSTYDVRVYYANAAGEKDFDGKTKAELVELLGKELADKIESQENKWHIYEGVDLKVGGGWTQAMYGNEQGLNAQGKPSLIMQAANELARKFGGEVGSVDLNMGEGYSSKWNPRSLSFDVTDSGGNIIDQFSSASEAAQFVDSIKVKSRQPALIITPAMRDKILNEGMPLFSVAFSPNQAKSATGNNGKFSESNPDIRYSMAWAEKVAPDIAHSIADHLSTTKTFNWWNRTVGSQFHKAIKDKDFGRVFNKSMQFEQDVAKFANENADLAPDILPKLGENPLNIPREIKSGYQRNNDLRGVGKAIFDTTLRDEPMTEQELDEAGLNTQQKKMYRQFFKAINASLDDVAKSEMFRVGRSLKLEPATPDMTLEQTAKWYAEQDEDNAKLFLDKAEAIKNLKKEGYAPLMRFGPFTVTVTDKDGSTAFFGMFETQAEANKIERAMMEEYPDSTVTKGIMSQEDWKLFRGVTPESMEVFAKLMNVEQDEAFQAYLKTAVNNRSALKRLIHRKKIKGFDMDVSRVLATFITSSARMASKNYHLGELVEAIADIPKEKGDVKDEAVSLYEFVQNPQTKGAAARNLLFTWYLGGSVASAMVNMTQTLTTTLPYLHQFGNTKQVASLLTKAMKLAANPKSVTGGLAEALKRAEEEGVTAPHELHMLYGESMRGDMFAPEWLRPLGKAWGSLFSIAEAYNRRVAFIAAYQLAEANKHSNPFKFAEDTVEQTQFLYSKSNRPNWARSTVGSMLFTFKQFSINYLELLSRLPRREQGIALGVLVLLAGAGGAPGADDLDDVIDTLGQAMGYNTNAKAWKEKAANDLLGKTWGDFALHGISAFTPFDVSGRLSVGNIIPGTAILKKSETDKSRDVLEFFGAAGSLAARAVEAFDAAEAREGGLQFAKSLSGALVPKAIHDLYQATDMLQTGQYRDVRGRKVADTEASDAIWKAIGLQPTKVSDKRQVERMVNQSITLAKAVESDIADLWAQGRFEDNEDKVIEAKSLLKKWNARNPASPIKIDMKQITKRLKQMRMTSRERMIKTAPREMRRYVMQELIDESVSSD